MKTPFYTLILVLFLFSCNNDDAQQNNEPTLNESWSLVNISGGLVGLDDDYETGIITWTFNTETSQVVVSNLNVELVVYDGLANGTYNCTINANSNPQTLNIENSSFNITVLTDTELILDQGIAVDGFLLTFSR